MKRLGIKRWRREFPSLVFLVRVMVGVLIRRRVGPR